MGLLFCDSFDHYATADIAKKWNGGTFNGPVIDTLHARTGRACLAITGAAEATWRSPVNVPEILIGDAFYTNTLVGGIYVIECFAAAIGPGVPSATCVHIYTTPAAAISAYRGYVGSGGVLLGSSAPGVLQLNAYNSLVVKVKVHNTLGTVKIWLNGALVLNLSNVNTTNPNNAALHYADGFTVTGPGGLPDCYHDDLFVFDCTTTPNNDNPGGFPRIYAVAPFADGSPVNWTPLGGGTHYTEVDEIPPDGNTSYNSSATLGQQDQYQYNPTGVPASSQILAVQHNLIMAVDSGTRSVASTIGGTAGSSFALTASYVDYTTPWDLNPDTGLAWTGADFPKSFGPQVTL